jgi:hypothetical protein
MFRVMEGIQVELAFSIGRKAMKAINNDLTVRFSCFVCRINR